MLVPESIQFLALRDGGPTLVAKPVYALVALDGSPVSEEVLSPVTQLVAELAPSEKKTLQRRLPQAVDASGLVRH